MEWILIDMLVLGILGITIGIIQKFIPYIKRLLK